MTFRDILTEVIDWLQQDERISYRALKRQFHLDDDSLDDLKLELIEVKQVAVDHDRTMLVWTGDPPEQDRGTQRETESETRLQAVLPLIIDLLQREHRVPYRTLKYGFGLDDALLAEVCSDLRFRHVAHNEGGKGLVWTGESPPAPRTSEVSPSPSAPTDSPAVATPARPTLPSRDTPTGAPTDVAKASREDARTAVWPNEPVVMPELVRAPPDAERRQLTVMFCDLVGSTDLSGTLDPEDLREVVRAYQETAAKVIQRYEGHIAQYLGDGLLIYFGYPVAHEDDAQRAVHTGLGIVEAMSTLNERLKADHGVELAVRIGIHTGPVVVGEMGGGGRHENLALGETPNIAARLEGLAEPNTVVMSPATAHLVQQTFVLDELGPYELKGVTEPMVISRVMRPVDSEILSPTPRRFDALVGRDEEIGLLLRRWGQSKESLGQVILLSGEAGIGKSSLVDGLQNLVRQEGLNPFAFRCSPYHTNSTLYPIIDSMQRRLGWQSDETDEMRLTKLEQALEATDSVPHEAMPLLASLLSLTLPEEHDPSLTLSPQQQRQQTQDTLVSWLQAEAGRHPMLAVWEDLHWADPSTLEVLELILEQAPTLPMLHVLTFRPEFDPPWPTRSHMTPITLNRLESLQAEAVISRLARGKSLPAEVMQHIVAKTDGVPLYIEELTKMLLSSSLLCEGVDTYSLAGPLTAAGIPNSLQDSLMARLDQLDTAKEVAQLGSVLGREFTYEPLQTLTHLDQDDLQRGLARLVEAEILYQRGRPPRATYVFKHALIQDAAYQSLLRSTRQHLHQQVAQRLESEFPGEGKGQPELVAYHYTEGGQPELAVDYWYQAVEQALALSAYQEAINYCAEGLAQLKMSSEMPRDAHHELNFLMALHSALMATKGNATPELESICTRAYELSQQTGDPVQSYMALNRLRIFNTSGGDPKKGYELARQAFHAAQSQDNLEYQLHANFGVGNTSFHCGHFSDARCHLENALALYVPGQHSVVSNLQDPKVSSLAFLSITLWTLGYPEQAHHRLLEGVAWAQALAQPYNQAFALVFEAWLYCLSGESEKAQEAAKATIAHAAEHGYPHFESMGTIFLGIALAIQGATPAGAELISKGLDDFHSTGAHILTPFFHIRWAEVFGQLDQREEALSLLRETLATIESKGEHNAEAEAYRLQGVLLLTQDVNHNAHVAEVSFHRALTIARDQQAKSWELRSATSLARLWQCQGKRQDAYDLLAPVYDWFTEGFDTADLVDAKTLLDELEESR